MASISGQTAIVGVGYTAFTPNSGKSVLSLAAEACKNAIEDAGLSPQQIDGIGCYSLYGDSVGPGELGNALGAENLHASLNLNSGGDTPPVLIGYAASLVYGGMANYMVVYRALNGRSGTRIGGTGRGGAGAQRMGGSSQFSAIYGFSGPPAGYAMHGQAYLARFGKTNRDFATTAVMMRRHAQKNPRAIMYGRPMTVEDHQNSRWIVHPFRLFDNCVEVDAAVALVVTTKRRAQSLKHRPVYIAGSAHGEGEGSPGDSWARWSGPPAMKMAGVTAKDVDVACISDDYTFTFLSQLEDFGFCKKGEGPDYVSAGRATYGGSVVCNPHGGQLSEGFVHDMNQVGEAVVQLRGEAGDRQVPNAEIALVSGTFGHSCAILTR